MSLFTLQAKKKVDENLLDKNNFAHWKQLKPGSIIKLTDVQAIEKSVYDGDGSGGVNYKVDEVQVHKHMDEGEVSGLCTWIFAKLERTGSDNLFLMVKHVDGETPETRIYYQPMTQTDDGETLLVPVDNRENMINEEGHGWLFDYDVEESGAVEPGDELLGLTYTDSISFSPTGDGVVSYDKKSFGELLAKTEFMPKGFMKNIISTIVEYKADENTTDNPEALVVEIGEVDSEVGGAISLYFGTQVSLEDVYLMKP